MIYKETILNRSTFDDEDYDEDDYFATYSESTFTDNNFEYLQIIKERSKTIREEVSKPHKCAGNKCICYVIKLNLDMLEMHIKNLEENLSNDKTARSPQES